jgi:DNA-binding NtrC family response regulator
LRRCDLYAPRHRNVVVVGETGTGKSLVAAELHRRSSRRDKELVRVTAAECEPQFVQALLAGHTRDAYTGAAAERRGLLEDAAGGTVFLDDVQDLPIESNSCLLDAVERRPLRAKGNGRLFIPDVRWVFGSQKPLAELVAEHKLKPDLAARMGRVEIHLQALRDHLADLELLVSHLLSRIAAVEGIAFTPASDEALAVLRLYSWPANVRELEDVLCESLIEAVGEAAATIQPRHLPENLREIDRARRRPGRPSALRDEIVVQAFGETGSYQTTAKQLGISARTVRRRIGRGVSQGNDDVH